MRVTFELNWESIRGKIANDSLYICMNHPPRRRGIAELASELRAALSGIAELASELRAALSGITELASELRAALFGITELAFELRAALIPCQHRRQRQKGCGSPERPTRHGLPRSSALGLTSSHSSWLISGRSTSMAMRAKCSACC